MANPPSKDQPQAALTTQMVKDLVLNRILENFGELSPKELDNQVAHIQALLHHMTEAALEAASLAIANRCNLSPLPAFSGVIEATPEQDSGDQAYGLRYRMVEQIGDQTPYLDKVMSLDEAIEEYGESFVDSYWGTLGENSPRHIQAGGNRNIWFTTVRYPIASLDMTQGQDQGQPIPKG